MKFYRDFLVERVHVKFKPIVPAILGFWAISLYESRNENIVGAISWLNLCAFFPRTQHR